MKGFRSDSYGGAPRRGLPRSRRMNLATLGDFPAAYAGWVASVKYLGGVPVVWPTGVAPARFAGRPAARYDVATFTALTKAGKLSSSAIVGRATSGAYVYVLAPSDVAAAAVDLVKPTDAEIAALPKESLLDRWFPGASKYVKVAAIGGGILLGLQIFNAVRPRSR